MNAMGEEKISYISQKINMCSTCGLTILGKKTAINDVDSQEIREFNFCELCLPRESCQPSFIGILLGITDGMFIERLGIKDPKTALRNAHDHLSKLPYWKRNTDMIVKLEDIEENFVMNYLQLHSQHNIIKFIRDKEQGYSALESADIFISHSWQGPDNELVDPLVAALRELGYSIWYDKEKGLEPGELEKFLKRAILISKNCIPIICKEYFQGHYTKYELEMLYKIKEKKHIIPIWWTDDNENGNGVDSSFLETKGDLGKQILNTSGITWENCGKDLNVLVKIIDNYITTNMEKRDYNGIKLYESEYKVLKNIESLTGLLEGDFIPVLKNSDQEFGFEHQDNHITHLILRKTEKGRKVAPFNLPENFSKLRYLQKLNAPIISIPKNLHTFKNLEILDLHEGMLEILPNSLGNLDPINLKEFNIMGNPYIHTIEEKATKFLDQWIQRKDLYQNLTPELARTLYIIQIGANLSEPIPEIFSEQRFSELDKPFGFVLYFKKITHLGLNYKDITFLPDMVSKLKDLEKLDLSQNQLTSLPESIGELTSLKELKLWQNKLTSIPKSIGNLISLNVLYLDANELSSLPESLFNLKTLNKLILSYNRLSFISDSIGNLNLLEILDLESNILSYLPESIGLLTLLKELWLSSNKLNSLPESIGNLTLLEDLDLEGNQLSNLPTSLENLTQLKNLNLSDNIFKTIPDRLEKWIETLKKQFCKISM